MFNWWTFAFEIINFIIVIFILYRLLFRPIRDMILKRKEEIEQSKTEIEKGREDVENLKNELEGRLKELDMVKKTVIEEARIEALKERERILKDTKKEMEREREKLRKLLDDERKKLFEEVKGKSIEISTELSGKIMASIMDTVLNEALVNKTLNTVKALNREERDEIKGDSDGCVLQVSSAHPLSEETKNRIIKTVEEVFGCKVKPHYNTLPHLIGGVMIRINSKVFDGTIRGNIERIGNSLKEKL
jgi:F-type H+-transporting ATPase subunit b